MMSLSRITGKLIMLHTGMDKAHAAVTLSSKPIEEIGKKLEEELKNLESKSVEEANETGS